MTMVRGVRVLAAPCCGRRYAFTRYVTMNFMAFEHWTDGWREGSLMPNDEGLRRCKCGQFLLIKHLVEVQTAESSDLPWMDHVDDEALGECIAKAASQELEIAARLTLWRTLNHPYRERYRQHRDAEEAATKATWQPAHPDRRGWWDKLIGRKAPNYTRPEKSPITCPAYGPSPLQLQNMERLTQLLISDATTSGYAHRLELAELYREQSRFDDARQMIRSMTEREVDVTSEIITGLIRERQPAPARFRM